jgi:hypothetical protein
MSTAKEDLARLIEEQPDDRSAEEIIRESFTAHSTSGVLFGTRSCGTCAFLQEHAGSAA